MPNLRIHALIECATIEVACGLGPAATVSRVSDIMTELYWANAPSLRKIQDILRDHKAQTAVLDSIPRIRPLGKGWPTDSEDVRYLGGLESLLWPGSYRWTEPKIQAALECKGLLSKYPANSNLDRLGLIEEIATRRVLDVDQFDDLYDAMIADHLTIPVMTFGLNGLANEHNLEFYRRAKGASSDPGYTEFLIDIEPGIPIGIPTSDCDELKSVGAYATSLKQYFLDRVAFRFQYPIQRHASYCKGD